jgi:predicted nucleotidyltransferase
VAARNDSENSEDGVTHHPLKGVVITLHEHLGASLRGVVLFGSRARGDARPDSDWDLLLVADGLPASVLERSRMLRNALPAQWCGRAAIIAKTPPEFETEFPAYYLDVGSDGQILYDKDGYLEARLTRIRQRMQEAGLQRRRLAHGFFWAWQTPPRGPWRIDWDGVHGLGIGR